LLLNVSGGDILQRSEGGKGVRREAEGPNHQGGKKCPYEEDLRVLGLNGAGGGLKQKCPRSRAGVRLVGGKMGEGIKNQGRG